MPNDKDNTKGAGKFLDAETWDAMKAAGFTEDELQKDQPFGPVIFSYSRAQAIEDGVLIDVTEIARGQGFRLHTVVTCGLWSEIGREEPLTERPRKVGELLHMLRGAVAANPNTDRIHFQFEKLAVWALCGPGDDGEAVLTVMLEGED
jgi:hypothetical protein